MRLRGLVADRSADAVLVDAEQDQIGAACEEPGGGRGGLIVRGAVDEAFAIERARAVAAGGNGSPPFGVGGDVQDERHRLQCRRPGGGEGDGRRLGARASMRGRPARRSRVSMPVQGTGPRQPSRVTDVRAGSSSRPAGVLGGVRLRSR
jgi:hypothetical protein